VCVQPQLFLSPFARSLKPVSLYSFISLIPSNEACTLPCQHLDISLTEILVVAWTHAQRFEVFLVNVPSDEDETVEAPTAEQPFVLARIKEPPVCQSYLIPPHVSLSLRVSHSYYNLTFLHFQLTTTDFAFGSGFKDSIACTLKDRRHWAMCGANILPDMMTDVLVSSSTKQNYLLQHRPVFTGSSLMCHLLHLQLYAYYNHIKHPKIL
jgi:hypothetical protein